MNDPYHLQRFVDAQAPVFQAVCAELEAGRKRSHWMWFVFPQIEGLGHSDMARRFALATLDEARAYLGHPVLGERLRAVSRLVAAVDGRSAVDIFGATDAVKFRSSMTLFAHAAPDEALFGQCLDKYFGGNGDSLTLRRLGLEGGAA